MKRYEYIHILINMNKHASTPEISYNIPKTSKEFSPHLPFTHLALKSLLHNSQNSPSSPQFSEFPQLSPILPSRQIPPSPPQFPQLSPIPPALPSPCQIPSYPNCQNPPDSKGCVKGVLCILHEIIVIHEISIIIMTCGI